MDEDNEDLSNHKSQCSEDRALVRELQLYKKELKEANEDIDRQENIIKSKQEELDEANEKKRDA